MMQPEPQAERFPLGRVVATAGLLRVVEADYVAEAISRHSQGDWGDVLDEDDVAANEVAIRDEARVVSSYWLPSSVKPDGEVRIYVITEADRSATTALLASEY